MKFAVNWMPKVNQKQTPMTHPKNKAIARLVLGLSLLVAAGAFAQEQAGQPEEAVVVPPNAQAASNLMLAVTSFKTENQILTFGFNSVAGFAPTTFVCPPTHKAGCTIRVEVSAGIWAVSPSNVAQMFLKISGPGAALDPNSVVNVSNNTGPLADAATFQFMKRQIPAGSTQTVNIHFQMGFNGGSANTGFRTATVQLYLN